MVILHSSYMTIGTRLFMSQPPVSLLRQNDLIGRDGDRKPVSSLEEVLLTPVMLRVSGLLKANPGQEQGPCPF